MPRVSPFLSSRGLLFDTKLFAFLFTKEQNRQTKKILVAILRKQKKKQKKEQKKLVAAQAGAVL